MAVRDPVAVGVPIAAPLLEVTLLDFFEVTFLEVFSAVILLVMFLLLLLVFGTVQNTRRLVAHTRC